MDAGLENLEKTRRHLARRVRELRLARGFTQADLAARLDMSQSRLSEIEGGRGSFSAEQFLLILAIFNVDIGSLGLTRDDPDGDLQNALARAGAKHLAERADVVPTGRYARPADVVSAVLLDPGSERWVTALAPVLVWSADAIPLRSVRQTLADNGVPNRLGWLVENTAEAIRLVRPPDGPWSTRARRAAALFRPFIATVEPVNTNDTPWDPVDRGVRSERSWNAVAAKASAISRRWAVLSEIQPSDFARALEGAYGFN